MSRDVYITLAERAEFRQKIERSDFLGIAFPVVSEEDFFGELQRIEKKHFDATHHCWAFRLRERTRSSDAGEPSGTAGRPILAAIDGASLYETAVVVVRWFGGVKLGTGGLSRAYRETAAETLRHAKTIDRYEYARFQVVVPFDMLSHAYRLVDPPHVVLVEESFAEHNEFTFDVRRSRAEEFARTLAEKRLSFRA
jgi:uncharacterized YigZ family protein